MMTDQVTNTPCAMFVSLSETLCRLHAGLSDAAQQPGATFDQLIHESAAFCRENGHNLVNVELHKAGVIAQFWHQGISKSVCTAPVVVPADWHTRNVDW